MRTILVFSGKGKILPGTQTDWRDAAEGSQLSQRTIIEPRSKERLRQHKGPAGMLLQGRDDTSRRR